MAVRRRFTQEFKLAVVREYLAGGVSRAALARQYDVAPGQIQAWQKRYKQGRLSDQPADNGASHARIAELERMVGQLTMEKELSKKAAAWAQQPRSEDSTRGQSGTTRRLQRPQEPHWNTTGANNKSVFYRHN